MIKRRLIHALSLVAALLVASPQAAASQAPPVSQAVLSPEATAALDSALAGTDQGDVELLLRGFFYPSMQGGTLCMMGFRVGTTGVMFGVDASAEPGVAAPEVAEMELFGAILQDGVEIRRIGTNFKMARNEATHSGTYSFGDSLPAGSYELVWGVRDSVSGVTGSRRDAFEAPNFMAGGLTLTSIIVADGFGPAPGMFSPNTVYDGVRVLTTTFHDRVERVYEIGTPQVDLTYVVMGAQMDPATQAYNLEANYRILDAETGQSVVRMPPQPMSRNTVAQPIPLGQIQQLEAGKTYRFEIVVKDLSAGTEATQEVAFQIAG